MAQRLMEIHMVHGSSAGGELKTFAAILEQPVIDNSRLKHPFGLRRSKPPIPIALSLSQGQLRTMGKEDRLSANG